MAASWGTVGLTQRKTTNSSTIPQFATNGTDVVVVSLNPRELVVLTYIVDFTGTTDDVICRVNSGTLITSGTADAGSATNTLDLATAGGTPITTATLDDDDLIGMTVIITGGAAEGDIRMITDFDGTTNDRITVANNFSTTTDNTSTYSIYAFSPILSWRMPVDQDPSLLDNTTKTIKVTGYDYLAFSAYQSGTTDTHNFQVAYRKDGLTAP